MSKSIDERIVSMKFDNAQFEKGVSQTIASLDKLKKGANLDSLKTGLLNMSQGLKGFSVDAIAKGIEGLTNKFKTLGIIGIATLTNLTNKAVDAGLQLAKSLTIDPIKQGFDEYELKMGSIQTILANTSRHGTGLNEVTAALDDLNTYADKTIYNFGDMTRNIGLFTNAGIKVEDATSMIKGFSNEAAASGTNAQGAAGAAYQLSQALSAGKITLMDWRSLQNAGMGNKNMQNGLIEIADAMGTFNGKGIDAKKVTEDFNGSLEKGWLTADVMQNYLKIQAGDLSDEQMKNLGLSNEQIEVFKKQQKMSEEAATKVRTWTQLVGTLQEGVGSSWAQTFDILLGNFDQATELFTGISDTLGGMISASGDARNKLLQEWANLGGRDKMIAALGNVFQALLAIMKPITEAFKQIFPPVTAQTLLQLTERFLKFTESLKIGGETADKIKRTFAGVFALLSIGWQIVKTFLGVLADIFGVAQDGAGSFLGVTASIGDFLVKIDDTLKKGDLLQQIFGRIGQAATWLIDGIKAAIGIVVDFGKAVAETVGSKFSVNGFTDFIEKIKTRLTPLAGLGRLIRKIWTPIAEFFVNLYETVRPVLVKIGEVMGQVFDKIKEAFGKADFNDFADLFNVGVLVAIYLAIKKFITNVKGLFGGDDGGGFLGPIKDAFDGLTDTLGQMQATLKASTLMQIAIAIALMAASVIALSMVDSEDLTKAVTALGFMMSELVGAMALFGKATSGFSAGKLIVLAGGLILISLAVLILVPAVKSLAELDWDSLVRGLTGLGVVLLMMVAVSKPLGQNAPGMIAAGFAMILMSAGIKILASVVEDLSELSWENMIKGLVAVGALLAGLTLFNKFATVNKGSFVSSVGILILGSALKVMASAVEDFASMDTNTIITGLVSIGAILAVVALFSKVTGGGTTLIATSVGLVIIAAAMLIFSEVFEKFGKMEWEEIFKASVMLAAALAIVAAGMVAMEAGIVGAAALLIAAAALWIMIPPLIALGEMDWQSIGKASVMLFAALTLLSLAMIAMEFGIVGALGIIAAALALMILVPPLILLGAMSWEEIGKGLTMLAGLMIVLALGGIAMIPASVGFVLLGAAILLIGTGVFLAAIGLGLLATAIASLAGSGYLASQALGAMIDQISTRLPQLGRDIAQAFVSFLQEIANATPQITEAIKKIITAILDMFGDLIPKITEVATKIMLAILDAFDAVSPRIIDTVWNLITQMLQKFRDNIPLFVSVGMELITGFLRGIRDNINPIVGIVVSIVITFMNTLGQYFPVLAQAGANLIINFINSMANAIRNNQEAMRSAGRNLGGAIIDGMTGGLASGVGEVANKARSVASSALQAAKDRLGIHSPSREFKKIGQYTMQGWAIGMDQTGSSVVSSAENVATKTIDVVADAISRIPDEFESLTNTDPVIRPVLDLDQFKKDAQGISSALGSPQLAVDNNTRAAESIADARSASTDDIDAPQGTTIVNFQQNNTSPKALGSVEIYRNTKSLLSLLETK